jgi:hypothetical protein
MLSRLVKRRTVWWPTWLGWLIVAGCFVVTAGLWAKFGESFLAREDRRPAEVLIVEGWIGIEGIQAAKTEFEKGGYRYIVTAGTRLDNRWIVERWNAATEAAEILVRLGLPESRVIAAPTPGVATRRTFESALTVRDTLAVHKLTPECVNVFTLGVHSRRSQLIYAKVLPSTTNVGVVSWIPPDYHMDQPWWHSSERAIDLLKESVGYFWEAAFNSGRLSNSPRSMAN